MDKLLNSFNNKKLKKHSLSDQDIKIIRGGASSTVVFGGSFQDDGVGEDFYPLGNQFQSDGLGEDTFPNNGDS